MATMSTAAVRCVVKGTPTAGADGCRVGMGVMGLMRAGQETEFPVTSAAVAEGGVAALTPCQTSATRSRGRYRSRLLTQAVLPHVVLWNLPQDHVMVCVFEDGLPTGKCILHESATRGELGF